MSVAAYVSASTSVSASSSPSASASVAVAPGSSNCATLPGADTMKWRNYESGNRVAFRPQGVGLGVLHRSPPGARSVERFGSALSHALRIPFDPGLRSGSGA